MVVPQSAVVLRSLGIVQSEMRQEFDRVWESGNGLQRSEGVKGNQEAVQPEKCRQRLNTGRGLSAEQEIVGRRYALFSCFLATGRCHTRSAENFSSLLVVLAVLL